MRIKTAYFLLAMGAVYAIAVVGYAQQTQPTTQPATVSDLLAAVPQPTQSQIRDSLTSAHIDPTTLPAISFSLEGDITTPLNNLKANGVIYLKPSGAYISGNASGSAVVSGLGARILGDIFTPANIKITRTGLALNAPNIEFSGIHASGFAKLLEVTKPGAHIHDCTADSLGQFAQFEAGSDNFILENITASKMGSFLAYVVSSNGIIRNCTVSSMTSPNSEYCIRTENDGAPNGKVCTNLLIDRCDLTNDSTSLKPALGAREFQDLALSNSTFRSYIVFGQNVQNGAPPAGTALMRATIKDCKFPGPTPGAPFPKGGVIVDIRDGCDVLIDGATFGPFADPRQSCIHVKGTSKLRYRNIVVNGTLSVPPISSDPGAVVTPLP